MYLYGTTGEPVAQRALVQLVAAIQERDPLVAVKLGHDGVGWASCELSSPRDPRIDLDPLRRDLMDPKTSARGALPVYLQVSTRPDVVPAMVQHGLDDGGPVQLADCDTLTEIHLVGPLIDWPTVRTIWAVAIQLWSAVPYVSGLGFDVVIDDLS